MADSITAPAEPKLTALAQNILDELQEQDAKGLEDPALTLADLSDAVMRTEKDVDDKLRYELEPAGLAIEVEKDRWCIPADPEDIGEAGWVADEDSLVTLPEDQPERVAEEVEPVNWQLLPPLSTDEYEALKADIAERGVLVPVEMDETGNLLDGHHRMRAVAELRSQGHPVCEPQRLIRKGWTDEQKRRHVYTLNLARRALTQEQKRDIACRLRSEGWTLEAIGLALAVHKSTAMRWTESQVADATSPPTITNARGQERPATYAPREQPQLDAILGDKPAETIPESYQDHTETIPAEEPPAAPAHAARRTDDRQTWATPQALFDVLHEEFQFTLDPCATPDNAKCERYFTAEDDGLVKSWSKEVVFCNPPYGDKETWVRKAWSEAANFGATVVLLIPVGTGTKLWRGYCRYGEVRFITGRLRFDDGGQAAPFDSALIIFRPGQNGSEMGHWQIWDAWQANGGEADV